MLGLSKLLILVIPFQRIAHRLGRSVGMAAWVPVLDTHEELRGSTIGALVQMAARATPWSSNCYTQALTARILLGLYGIPCSIFFGVARNSRTGEFEAHAWVTAGRIRVTGGNGFKHYVLVGAFVSADQAPSKNIMQGTR